MIHAKSAALTLVILALGACGTSTATSSSTTGQASASATSAASTPTAKPRATLTARDFCKLTGAEVSAILGFPVAQDPARPCEYQGVNPAGNGVSALISTEGGDQANARFVATANMGAHGTITDLQGFPSWAFYTTSPEIQDSVEIEIDLGQGDLVGHLNVLVQFSDTDPTTAAIALAHKIVPKN